LLTLSLPCPHDQHLYHHKDEGHINTRIFENEVEVEVEVKVEVEAEKVKQKSSYQTVI
jgi:hypothetical protein